MQKEETGVRDAERRGRRIRQEKTGEPPTRKQTQRARDRTTENPHKLPNIPTIRKHNYLSIHQFACAYKKNSSRTSHRQFFVHSSFFKEEHAVWIRTKVGVIINRREGRH